MSERYVKITEEDRNHFKDEIRYYILSVVFPMNLIFLIFLVMPGGYKMLTAIALLLDLLVYLTKIRPALEDIQAEKFLVKTGILRAVKFNISLEKFEYRMDGDEQVFSSLTSRYNVLLEHLVEVVLTERTRRVVKMRQL